MNPIEADWGFNPFVPLNYTIFFILLGIGWIIFSAWKLSRRVSVIKCVLMAAFRSLFIMGLAAISLNFGYWKKWEEKKKGEWAVLLDSSGSMSVKDGVKDSGTLTSRWEQAAGYSKAIEKELTDNEATKSDGFRIFTFSEKLNEFKGGAKVLSDKMVSPAGETRIEDVGASIVASMKSGALPLRGIFLISDGRQLEEGDETFALNCKALEVPVYTLPVGSNTVNRDLIVRALRSQKIGYPGQEVRLRAYVENEGLGAVMPTVSLKDKDGNITEEKTISFTDYKRQLVDFKVKHEVEGRYEYELVSSVYPEETSRVNNSTKMSVFIREHKTSVLFVEGRPFWDSKFLVQLYRKQPNIKMKSIHRITSERYFQVDDDEKETSESPFPETQEEMNESDMIIIGKGIEYFLDEQRIEMLDRFISEKGGCVVFARGKSYSGGFPGIERIEPVEWGEPINTKFRLLPTEEGMRSQIFSGILEGLDSPVWKEMHELKSAERINRLKSFSSVMVEGVFDHNGRQQTFPAVISRPYGKGVVILVNANGLWEWDFFPSVAENKELYQEFWTQLVQWAASFSDFLPGQSFALSLNHAQIQLSEEVKVNVKWRGQGQPEETLLIKVYKDDKLLENLLPLQSPRSQAEWESIYKASEPGYYRFELDYGDVSESPVTALLNVTIPPTEMENTSFDLEYLRRLGEDSGGEMLDIKAVQELIQNIKKESSIIELKEAEWQPLWNQAWVCLIVLVFFFAELFIRRREGLL